MRSGSVSANKTFSWVFIESGCRKASAFSVRPPQSGAEKPVLFVTFRLSLVRDAQRAEDVVQESFIRAYEHLGGFRGASAFATWLYRIAYNRAVGECRRRSFGRIDTESCAVAEEPSDERYDGETVARMRRALERLRPEERALVTLFYEEERSVAEIAQIMDLSLSNFKVRLHRLRGRLRGYMGE